MGTQANSGIARRRATFRRVTITALVLVCLALFTGYFRETDGGPLHGAQSTAAGVVAPVQEVATRAVQPFRDAWGWATSLRDARDRAASLQQELDDLRATNDDDLVRDQRLAQLEKLLGVEGAGLGGYGKVTALVITRSVSPWYRSGRVNKGTADGVRMNSPVVASGSAGAALVGIVTRASAHTADVAFITDGRTEVGAKIPGGRQLPGPAPVHRPRPTAPVRRAARGRGAARVRSWSRAGTAGKGLEGPYPPGIPVGQVTSVGGREVDVQQTVQVTPYVDARKLDYLVVLTPQSPEALRRAAG